MQSPYKTNCFNYTKYGCKSRNDCIDKCTIELSLKICKSLPTEVFVDRYNQLDKFTSPYCTYYPNFDSKLCQQKYKQPDCVIQYYTIKTSVKDVNNEPLNSVLNDVDKTKSNLNKQDLDLVSYIRILQSNEPYTIYRHSPQQHPVEFICFIGGIISLWTEFSVLSIYAYGKRFLIKRQIQKQSKKSVYILVNKINSVLINKNNNKMPFLKKIRKFVRKKNAVTNVIPIQTT